MNDILNDNQKLALVLELFNAGDISNAIKIVESYRPKGKWQKHKTKSNKNWHKCSNCGWVDFQKSNYCPNCGANMRGE